MAWYFQANIPHTVLLNVFSAPTKVSISFYAEARRKTLSLKKVYFHGYQYLYRRCASIETKFARSYSRPKLSAHWISNNVSSLQEPFAAGSTVLQSRYADFAALSTAK